jgi:hypothetical protein
MWLNPFSPRWLGRLTIRRPARPAAVRRPGRRPAVRQLEDRMALSNFTAATVPELIADINAANTGGGLNTITLVAGNTFTLTAADNSTDGPTGLPVIAANDSLTIRGNGDTVERSTATGTPAFRLLDVASGASLALENLTLQGGSATGTTHGFVAPGGAIYSSGTLVLKGVTVQHNLAPYSGGGMYVAGGTATLTNDTFYANRAPGLQFGGEGGALFVSGGTVTLQGDTLDYNYAKGGGAVYVSGGTVKLVSDTVDNNLAGGAYGGGLYINGGTATVTGCTLDHNSSYAKGGGVYVYYATVHMSNDTVEFNKASYGQGGGLYIDPLGTVCLDTYTVDHIINNTASSHRNIFGKYKRCS